MPCQASITHKGGPPPVTTITCVGTCDPVYRKKTGKGKKGEEVSTPEEVKRVCRRITVVNWVEKESVFRFGNTYCACVIEGAGEFCRYAPETDPVDAGKLKKAACAGTCEPLWYDKEFTKPVSSVCAMIIEPDNTIKCVCYSS
jgi:hypothetical protein